MEFTTHSFDDRWPGNIDKPYCPPDAQWPCYEPPFYPYDQIHRAIPDIGTVVGRSMIYAPYRYVNIFLGIPYARPPILERRFMVSIPVGRPIYNMWFGVCIHCVKARV